MTIAKTAAGEWLIDGIPGDPSVLLVRLNGSEEPFVQGASEEEGWVEVLLVRRSRATGDWMAIAGLDGKPLTVKKRGVVTIHDRRRLVFAAGARV